jgi:hypothetical protein
VETDITDYLPDPAVPDPRPRQFATEEYHALSYTWGDPVFPETLEVLQHADQETPESLGLINITRNLHSALENLRRPDRVLVLWVDAVCINQGDLAERNSQVRNIPKTYTEASSVIVWLGTDSPKKDARRCLDFFGRLARLIADGNAEQQPDASWRRRFEINRMVSTFLDDITHATPIIIPFLERPWFRRRWIVQEVVLAKEVVLHCGTSSIPWPDFELAMIELFENDKGLFSAEHRTTMRTMTRMRHADAGARRQVPLDTLAEFSSFVCANPRDRLYALYGVIQHWFPGAEDSDRKLNQTGDVDYALSTEDVFTNFAILMMRLDDVKTKTVYKPVTHVLQLAGAFRQQSPPSAQANPLCGKMPSWVVDWTGTLGFEPLRHSPEGRDASLGIPIRQVDIVPVENNTRLLVTMGLPFDIVTASIPLDIAPLLLTGAVHAAKKALNQFLWQVAQRINETAFPCGGDGGNTYLPTGQHIVSAIATSLVANWEHTPANSYFAQHPRFPSDFLEQLASLNHHLPEILHKWPAYVELVSITMRGRALFLTAKGYIGIAAAGVAVGDVVCLLSNNKIPFVLRPRNGAAELQGTTVSIPKCVDFEDDGMYRTMLAQLQHNPSSQNTFGLVSDAYAHSLMHGEGASQPARRLKIIAIA